MTTSSPCGIAAGLVSVLVLGSGLAARPAVAQLAPAPAATRTGAPGVTAADVAFMAGMIVHHAQAVMMASWAPSHGASPAVAEVCRRIAVSQRDEIAYMQHWLADHHEPVPQVDTTTGRLLSMGGAMAMPGMSMADTAPVMPGMLNAAQLARLDGARGPAFDHFFLTSMIQHHEGALTMVQQLVNTPGAAQDPLVFQFASDISAGQAAEIDRMRHLLAAELFDAGTH